MYLGMITSMIHDVGMITLGWVSLGQSAHDLCQVPSQSKPVTTRFLDTDTKAV
jgi:hypothetical protein